MRRATCFDERQLSHYGKFLSTLSLRRATFFSVSWIISKVISIHALLAESDRPWPMRSWPGTIFLSTLSLRRATFCRTWPRTYAYDFYPRSPCGERLCRPAFAPAAHNFYPRSPCGERPTPSSLYSFSDVFLSTLSLRRATSLIDGRRDNDINFYPRSPCGERLTPARISSRLLLISIHALLAESDSGTARHT